MPNSTLIQQLETKLLNNPKSLLFARLADLYLKAGRPADAIEICENGLKNHPAYVTGYFILGKSFLAVGEHEKGESALKNALMHDHQYLSAHKMLGDLMARMGWENKAAIHYRDILEIDPFEDDTREMLNSFSFEADAFEGETLSSYTSDQKTEKTAFAFTDEDDENWKEELSAAFDALENEQKEPLDDKKNDFNFEDQITEELNRDKKSVSPAIPESLSDDIELEDYFSEVQQNKDSVENELDEIEIETETDMDIETIQSFSADDDDISQSHDADLSEHVDEGAIDLDIDLDSIAPAEEDKEEPGLDEAVSDQPSEEPAENAAEPVTEENADEGTDARDPFAEMEIENFDDLFKDDEKTDTASSESMEGFEKDEPDEPADENLPEQASMNIPEQIDQPFELDTKTFDASEKEEGIFSEAEDKDESGKTQTLKPVESMEDFDLNSFNDKDSSLGEIVENGNGNEFDFNVLEKIDKKEPLIGEDDELERIKESVSDSFPASVSTLPAESAKTHSDIQQEPADEPDTDAEANTDRPGKKSEEKPKEPAIVSPTLGEIYAAQGQYAKAINVYETLLSNNPEEKKYKQKINELKKKLNDQES